MDTDTTRGTADASSQQPANQDTAPTPPRFRGVYAPGTREGRQSTPPPSDHPVGGADVF